MKQITSSWMLGIGLVLAFDLGLSILLPEGLQTRTVDARLEKQLTLPAPAIIIMGDSVAAGGIDHIGLASAMPPHLETATINNYALPGASPLYYEAQLRRFIDAGIIPKAIVLAPHPANLGLPRPERFLGRFATNAEVWRFIKHRPNAAHLIHGLMARSSYSYRYREEVREFFARGDAGFFRTLYQESSGQPLKANVKTISLLEPVAHPDNRRAFGAIGAALRAPLTIDPAVESSLNRFYELASANDIKLFWARLPVCVSLAELSNFKKNQVVLDGYLSDLEKKGTMTVLGETLVLPDHCFSDPWHLSPYGKRTYSNYLAEIMAAVFR